MKINVIEQIYSTKNIAYLLIMPIIAPRLDNRETKPIRLKTIEKVIQPIQSIYPPELENKIGSRLDLKV